jgi:hypothetical protein
MVVDTVGWDPVHIAVVGGVQGDVTYDLIHEEVTHLVNGDGGGATWYAARLRYMMGTVSYLPVGVCSFGPGIDTELFCIYTNCFYTTIRYSNQQFACYNTVK